MHTSLEDIPALIVRSGKAVLELIPSQGAAVNRLTLALEDGKSFSIVEGATDFAEFQEKSLYRGVHLMPFANRVKDGKYTFCGKEYQLPINEKDKNNALHGFIWDRPMDTRQQATDDSESTIVLTYQYLGDSQGYPFRFEFQVSYVLRENSLTGIYKVTNIGEEAMPFSLGWHPYFQFEGEDVDELHLQMPRVNDLPLDNQMIPTGASQPYDTFSILSPLGKQHLDNCYKIMTTGDATTILASKSKKAAIKLTHNSDDGILPYVQIYTPPHRKSIAIEPMSSCVDALNNQKGLLVLEPSTSYTSDFNVSLEPWTT